MMTKDGDGVIAYQNRSNSQFRDRSNVVWYEVTYASDEDATNPSEIVVHLPNREKLVVVPGKGSHPTWLTSAAVRFRGQEIACVQSVDWLNPKWIPAVDKPSALPTGAGSALLNFLAINAKAARTENSSLPNLRYRGPYPTEKLFQSLAASFDVASGNLAGFTKDLAQGLRTGEQQEPSVEFLPRPFQRHLCKPDIVVDVRDGVERCFIHGKTFSGGTGCRRLLRGDSYTEASYWLGDHCVGKIASFDDSGRLIEATFEPAPEESPLIGTSIPDGFRSVFWLHAKAVCHSSLHRTLAKVISETSFTWGNCRFAVAERQDDQTLRINPDVLQKVSAERVPAVVAEEVVPILSKKAQKDLSATILSFASTGDPTV